MDYRTIVSTRWYRYVNAPSSRWSKGVTGTIQCLRLADSQYYAQIVTVRLVENSGDSGSTGAGQCRLGPRGIWDSRCTDAGQCLLGLRSIWDSRSTGAGQCLLGLGGIWDSRYIDAGQCLLDLGDR